MGSPARLLLLLVTELLDAEHPELVNERPERQAEAAGRFRLVPAGGAERIDDEGRLVLDDPGSQIAAARRRGGLGGVVGDRGLRDVRDRAARGRRGGADALGEIARLEDVALGDDDGA